MTILQISRTQLLCLIFIFLSTSLTAQTLIEKRKILNRRNNNTKIQLIDFDKDGQQEVVSISDLWNITFDEYQDGKLRQSWSMPTDETSGRNKFFSLSVGNIDEDDNTEVLAFNSQGSLLVLDSYTRSWQRLEHLNYRHVRELKVGDYNGDGKNELVLIKDDFGSPDYTLLVLDYETLDTIFHFGILKSTYFTITDTDGDDYAEVFFGRDTLRKFDFRDYSHETILDRPAHTYVFEDYDNDDDLELILLDNEGLYVYNYPSLGLSRFRPLLRSGFYNIYAQNVDGDAEKEFLLLNSTNLFCFDVSDADYLWDLRYSGMDQILIHDFEGDGEVELIHTDNNSNSGASHFYINNLDGSLRWQSIAMESPSVAILAQLDEEEGLDLVQLHSNGHRRTFLDEGGIIRISDYPEQEIKLERGFGGNLIHYWDLSIGQFLPNTTYKQVAFLEFNDQPHPDEASLHLISNGIILDSEPLPFGYSASIQVGNFDNDPEEEIVVTQQKSLLFFDIVDNQLVLTDSYDFDKVISRLRPLDLDEDGIHELAFYTISGDDFYVLDYPTKEILFTNSQYGIEDYRLADLDGDGQKELCGFGRYLTRIILLDPISFEELDILDLWPYTGEEITGLKIQEMDASFDGEEIFVLSDRARVYNIHSEEPLATSSFISTWYDQIKITGIDIEEDGDTDFIFGNRQGIFHYEYMPGQISSSSPSSTGSTENVYRLVQNPFGDEMQFQYLGSGLTDARIEIFNLEGKKMSSHLWSSVYPLATISVPSAELPAGVYIARISSLGTISSIKIIKTN